RLGVVQLFFGRRLFQEAIELFEDGLDRLGGGFRLTESAHGELAGEASGLITAAGAVSQPFLDSDRFIEPGTKRAAKVVADHAGDRKVGMIAFYGILTYANLTLNVGVVNQENVGTRPSRQSWKLVIRLGGGLLPIAEGLVRQLH